jgi:hypothetical protein
MANPFRTHRKLSWAVVSLLVASGAVAALELTDTTHWFHDAPVPQTASEFTKGEPATSSNGDQSNPNSPEDTNEKSSGSAGRHLIEPTGNFVSSHTAKTTSNEASTCNTTPGASCQITFTMGSLVKSLPAKHADAGGAVYWEWQPQDVGLTSGSWRVKATAKLEGKTKSASDASLLEVQ